MRKSFDTKFWNIDWYCWKWKLGTNIEQELAVW